MAKSILDIKSSIVLFEHCGHLSFSATKDEFCAWRKKIMTAVKIAGLSDVVVVYPTVNQSIDKKVEDGGSVNNENSQ